MAGQQIVHFGQGIDSLDRRIASLLTIVEIALQGQFGPVPLVIFQYHPPGMKVELFLKSH